MTSVKERRETIPDPAGGIPATFVVPEEADLGGRWVLLVHGQCSTQDEVGGIYRSLATQLADIGISSIRFDMPGCGLSPRPQTDYCLRSEMQSARTVLDWTARTIVPAPTRWGAVGFSHGAIVAMALSGRFEALAIWSFGLDPSRAGTGAHGISIPSEPVEVDLGFRRFFFGPGWFLDLEDADLPAIASAVHGRCLVVHGTADSVVSETAAKRLVAAIADDCELLELDGADHTLGALDANSTAPGSRAEQAVRDTCRWFESVL